MKKNGSDVECHNCQKMFYVPRHRLNTAHFCSRECADGWKVKPSHIGVCAECGVDKPLSEFYKNSRSKCGYVARCKSCYSKKAAVNSGRIYRSMTDGAKRRNMKFDITYNQFMLLWNAPCHYCGSPIKTIGIDRQDNEIGYVFSNVVPCCSACNFMKKEHSVESFLLHCQRIAEYSLSVPISGLVDHSASSAHYNPFKKVKLTMNINEKQENA